MTLVCVGAVPGMATELWNQDYNPSICFSGASSQDARNPGGLGWFSEVADNFTAGADWVIEEVDFQGGYALPSGQLGHTQGFTIRFYTDDNGMPGTRIYEQDVMTFTETEDCSASGLAGYHYTVALDQAFAVPSAGTYWVSVVALLDRGGGSDEPQWGWAAAQTINEPPAVQWFFSPGNFMPLSNDVAFTLIGTAGAPVCRGDCNCDGRVDFGDINAFVAVLSGGTPCAFGSCDINGDGHFDFAETNPFVALLSGGGGPCH